jgi:S-adenosylhomocysteine hydrolase
MSGRPRPVSPLHRSATDFPAIRAVIEHLGLVATQPFRDHSVLAVQHVQKSLLPLIDALVLGGADPARIAVVGKSYSTTDFARKSLSDRGVLVDDPRRMADSTRSYEGEIAQRVSMVLGSVTGDRRHPLLILDEGGLAVRALRERDRLPQAIAAVEQTTRGARGSSPGDLGFPLVDVARSAAKIDVEGPLIAASMWRGITTVAHELACDLSSRRVGLIGFGTVGRNLATYVRRAGFDLVVADTDVGRLAQAEADGLATAAIDSLLASCDVILGCTGMGVVVPEQVDVLRPEALLINCASSDIEYRLWGHRHPEAVAGGVGTDASVPWDCHFRIGRSHRLLVAGGFAVNFYNTEEPVSSFDFQITRALMLAGAVQAVGSAALGLVELDGELQRVITRAYRETTAS